MVFYCLLCLLKETILQKSHLCSLLPELQHNVSENSRLYLVSLDVTVIIRKHFQNKIGTYLALF